MVWARSEISLHTNQTIEAPRLYLRPHVRQVVTKQWCRLVPPAPNKTGWKRTKGPRGDDILRLWTTSGQKAVLNRRFPSFFFLPVRPSFMSWPAFSDLWSARLDRKRWTVFNQLFFFPFFKGLSFAISAPFLSLLCPSQTEEKREASSSISAVYIACRRRRSRRASDYTLGDSLPATKAIERVSLFFWCLTLT